MDKSAPVINWYGTWIPREQDGRAWGIRNTLTKVRVGAGGPAPGHQSGTGRQLPSLISGNHGGVSIYGVAIKSRPFQAAGRSFSKTVTVSPTSRGSRASAHARKTG